MKYISTYRSPLGTMFMTGTEGALTALWFEGQRYMDNVAPKTCVCDSLPLFDEVRLWLDIYFSGKRPDFTPTLAPEGTLFRLRVWRMLSDIEYGQTITYGQLASSLSSVGKCNGVYARAVGGAVGHNPIALIVPCHRVVGADGSLTGYAGGIERKRYLLRLEGVDCG